MTFFVGGTLLFASGCKNCEWETNEDAICAISALTPEVLCISGGLIVLLYSLLSIKAGRGNL